MGLPIFVQANRDIPRWERGQPLEVEPDLGRAGGPVVAVQVDASGIFPRTQLAALGVEAGANPQVQVIGPGVVSDQIAQGHQSSGFVAVDSGREVESWTGSTEAREEDQLMSTHRGHVLGESVAVRENPDLLHNSRSVDSLTAVAGVVHSQTRKTGQRIGDRLHGDDSRTQTEA